MKTDCKGLFESTLECLLYVNPIDRFISKTKIISTQHLVQGNTDTTTSYPFSIIELESSFIIIVNFLL